MYKNAAKLESHIFEEDENGVKKLIRDYEEFLYKNYLEVIKKLNLKPWKDEFDNYINDLEGGDPEERR